MIGRESHDAGGRHMSVIMSVPQGSVEDVLEVRTIYTEIVGE